MRLDLLLVNRGFVESRQRAQALIMSGKVLVSGYRIDKPGKTVPVSSEIEITGTDNPFVSRGGLKLAHALKCFEIDVSEKVCMDVGASTGGFTDCLLENGAARVYAVDVGYGQLDWRLRNDPRVVVMERTNIRHMEPGTLPEPVEFATVDVSFISLRIVVPSVIKHLSPRGELVVLIKPQFEVGKGEVGKGGIVKDPLLHQRVIQQLSDCFRKDMNLKVAVIIPSPIKGAKGNQEFLAHLKRAEASPASGPSAFSGV